MKNGALNKEYCQKVEDFLDYVEKNSPFSEKPEENQTRNQEKSVLFCNSPTLAIADKIQSIILKLDTQFCQLKGQSQRSDIKSVELGIDSLVDSKSITAENKAVEEKKVSKKAPKNILMTHMEIKKSFLTSILEIVNSTHFKIDHNAYRQLAINSFDFLPYISQKLTSSISTYKDINLELLNLCWKLMSIPKSNVTFNENQKLIGIPDILPLRYGQEGPLLKNTLKNNSKKQVSIKKGIFSFHEDVVQIEIVRLLKKIHNTSSKQLLILSAGPNKEEKPEESFCLNIKDLYKECKNALNTKIHMYKINFLSFLMLLHIENQKFEIHALKSREIKSDYFERPLQLDHIKQWESRVLSGV